MNIIAIDPGPTSSAVIQWNGSRVIEPRENPNEVVRDWLKHQAPNAELAVEMIACYGMPVGAETFETCLFIGRLQEIWLARNNPLHLIYRREVKMHLCGTMKAKDGNIRQSLIDKLVPQGTKKAPGPTYGVSKHLWSALAVAITAAETRPR